MHILQVNCFFARGSTGKIVADIRRDALAAGHTVTVCYGRHYIPDVEGVYKTSSELEAKIHSVFSRLFGVEFGFSPIATARLIRQIKRERPDVVHLHCLNGHFVNAYRLLNFLKKKRIRTVLTLHAEDLHTAGCAYAVECQKWRTECHDCDRLGGSVSRFFRDDARHCFYKMKRALADFPTLTAAGVSDWVASRAAQSPLFEGVPITTVGNGLDTTVFKPQETAALRERLGLSPDEKVVLYVTPHFYNPMKGGEAMVELARRMPDQRFIIVGFDADPAILPNNVIPIAHTQDQVELAAFYTMAEATLLPSLRETFSMVTAESLCCGTPIIGFEAGAPETIALPDYSTFVPQGDVAALQVALEESLNTTYDAEAMVREAHERYATAAMTGKYLALYQS